MVNDMRLGDLDKAEAVLRNIADHLKESGAEDLLWAAAYTAADVVKKQRTIDAVPVVRCKDCDKCEYCVFTGLYWCAGNGMRGEDFCSRGERKDGDGK